MFAATVSNTIPMPTPLAAAMNIGTARIASGPIQIPALGGRNKFNLTHNLHSMTHGSFWFAPSGLDEKWRPLNPGRCPGQACFGLSARRLGNANDKRQGTTRYS